MVNRYSPFASVVAYTVTDSPVSSEPVNATWTFAWACSLGSRRPSLFSSNQTRPLSLLSDGGATNTTRGMLYPPASWEPPGTEMSDTPSRITVPPNAPADAFPGM